MLRQMAPSAQQKRGQRAAAAAAAGATRPLLEKIQEHPDYPGIQEDGIFYLSTIDRLETIEALSQTKEGLPLGEGKLVEVDPNRIDAIRFTDPGWQGRFSLYKHLADTLGWYAIDSQSIKAWPASMLDRARKYPMRTVEQADGAREAEEVGAAACGLAHTSPALKILFRADASGSAVACVLCAFGNLIGATDPDHKGLDSLGSILANPKQIDRLTVKAAGQRVRELTGCNQGKIKCSVGELYNKMMSRGENKKFMAGDGGLYVVSPETHDHAAGHAIGVDANRGLIYDCAASSALPLTVENMDLCSGNDALCIGIVRMRSLSVTAKPAELSTSKRKHSHAAETDASSAAATTAELAEPAATDASSAAASSASIDSTIHLLPPIGHPEALCSRSDILKCYENPKTLGLVEAEPLDVPEC